MKTVQQLQEEVYDQALNSGYFRNMQAQLKSYVFDVSVLLVSWLKNSTEVQKIEASNMNIPF